MLRFNYCGVINSASAAVSEHFFFLSESVIQESEVYKIIVSIGKKIVKYRMPALLYNARLLNSAR